MVIKGVKGLTITELGLDIKNDSFSPAGLRFEVLTEGADVLPFSGLPVPDSTRRPQLDAGTIRFYGLIGYRVFSGAERQDHL